MDQISSPITTADSQADGRLIVGAGSMRSKKRNILKSAIKKYKKDGKGGPGDTLAPNMGSPTSFGAPNTTGMLPSNINPMGPTPNVLPTSPAAPTLGLSSMKTGFKLARPLKLKKLNNISSAIKGVNKKMKLGKVAKSKSLSSLPKSKLPTF